MTSLGQSQPAPGTRHMPDQAPHTIRAVTPSRLAALSSPDVVKQLQQTDWWKRAQEAAATVTAR